MPRLFSPIILTTFFLITIPDFGNAAACALQQMHHDKLLELKEIAQKIEKQTQIDVASKSPAEFCENNMLIRYINANPKDSSAAGFSCNEMSTDELKKYVDRTTDKSIEKIIRNKNNVLTAYSPWDSSMLLTSKSQKVSMLSKPEYNDVFDGLDAYGKPKKADLNIVFDKLVEANIKASSKPSKKVFSKELSEKINNNFEKLDNNHLGNSSVVQATICADFNLQKTVGCAKALDRVLELNSPAVIKTDSESLKYTPLTVWKKILDSEDTYAEGLRLAALKLSQKVKNKNTDGSNILNDLTDSFEQSGMSKSKATDAAYEILAIYANSGANLGARVTELYMENTDNNFKINGPACTYSNDERPNICGYLDIIGRSIPFLDYMNTQQKIKPYSFPDDVVGFCNTNKSYHFWMSAYLSRQLIKEGFSADTARLATYISAVGYQVNRAEGRAGIVKGAKLRNFNGSELTKSSYDPVLNIIRADLAYADAGAQYGIKAMSPNSTNEISVDKSLVKLLKGSKETVSDYSLTDIKTLDQINKYRRFNEIISPKSVFSED